jgi:methionine-S-sulfoxide reductase
LPVTYRKDVIRMQLPPNPNEALSFKDEQLSSIVLAGGCFWGTQAYLRRIPGVASTECGYANGHTENPNYELVCSGTTGYAEAVRVMYDAALIPLETLVADYFKSINPLVKDRQGPDIGTQYRTGIYYSDAKDLAGIQAVLAEEQKKHTQPIVTELAPLSCFYRAEDYHQDYLERHPHGYCHVNLSLLAQKA